MTFLSAVPNTPDSQEPTLFLSNLAGHIRGVFEENKRARRDVEVEMMEALRQRNGEYSDAKLVEIKKFGGSEVFLPLTTMQCVAAASWVLDIILPPGKRGWSIDPTPDPELPQEWKQAISARLQQEVAGAAQQGRPPSPQEVGIRARDLDTQVRKLLKEKARAAALKMETRIADQLEESNWEDTLEAFVDDFVTFPTAFGKTITKKRKEVQWSEKGPVVRTVLVDEDVRVSPFDMLPAPGQTNMDNGDLIEKVRFTRSGLYDMIGEEGYDEVGIRMVLHEHKNGGLRDFETYTEQEQKDAERKGDTFQDDGLIEGARYWGKAQGSHLIEWGVDEVNVPDRQKEYEIDAILIGRHVIKVSLNKDPLGRRIYFKASYRNRPGSFWGMGIPWLIRHHQDLCNGTARALSNNMGMASGPQIMVLVDRMPKGESITSLHPLKIWQMVSDPAATGQQSPPISFFQPDSNAQELLGVLTYFWEQVSDITGIHRISYGSDSNRQGASQTFRGASLLLDQASKTVKAAVRHLDKGVIEPRIRRQYDQNMLNDPDPSIKGDAKVVAKGSKTLAAEAAKQTARAEFLQMTANPMDMQIMGMNGRADLLREIAEDMDLSLTLPNQDQIYQMQNQQQQPDPKMEAAKLNAETRLKTTEMELADDDKDRALKWQIEQLGAQREQLRLEAKKRSDLGKAKTSLAETIMKTGNERQKIADNALASQGRT